MILLHSDELIKNILNDSNKYLEDNPEVTNKISEYYRTFQLLFELLPKTTEKSWPAHVFPIVEAGYELEYSIFLCKIGFYKHAIISLRNVLELSLLSVYWDIDSQNQVNIENWFQSEKETPFNSYVREKLKKNSNIKTFDEQHEICEKTKKLFTKLSSFVHTKGFYCSSRHLSKHRSSVSIFNEKSLNKWLRLMLEVVEVSIVFHVLKYPIALQYTPTDDKLGTSAPAGGFLQPTETEEIKKLIPDSMLADLQEISDNDPDARAMTKWVNEQPDLTEEKMSAQFEATDKIQIKTEGYNHWIKFQRKLYEHIKTSDPIKYKNRLEDFEKLRAWAKENNYL